MKKIYCLSTCDTCRQLIKDIDAKKKGFEMQDIKENKITPEQLDKLHEMTGSYESLFSRRAVKYKTLGLKDKALKESDFRKLILEEYTFLKRPVVVLNKKVFVGSDKKILEELKSELK